jgi:mono/diheme cytochrome c family protein
VKFKYFLVVLVLIFGVTTYLAQEKKESGEKPAPAAPPATAPAAEQAPAVPHGFNITPEDAARKNPVRFSEINVQRGKKIYETQCAMCHGEKGDGKGDLAEEMKITPPDFTKPDTLAKRTDGELFTIIQSGSATMPGQSARLKDTHKWEVVNYLRSLSGKTPLKSTEEELHQGTVIVKDKN